MPPAAQRATRVRYWVIVFAVSLAVITYIDRVSIATAAPSIQHDVGLDDVQMGWAFGAFAWAYALFEIPGGFLGDWMGPRKVLLRVVAWWSFFTAASIQVKLLRVLQEREFERLGSNVTRHIDVRVVAATNQDLRAALEQGTFREDLYYRLNVVSMNIPPLRERKEDIPFLAQHFVTKLGPDTGNRVRDVTDAGIAKLMSYHWPGNVRELENVIERSLVMCSGERLDAADIKLEMAPRSRAQADQADRFLPDGLTLDQYEQDLIREALRRADGNKSQAARLLGLTRNALRYRLTQMGLES